MTSWKRILLLSVLISIGLIPFRVLSQCYFHKVYDYDSLHNFGYAVFESYDEGIISAGNADVYPFGDGTYIVKTNSCGDTVWSRVYVLVSGSGGEAAKTIIQLEDSSYMLFGSHYDTAESASSSFLFQISKQGDSLYYKNVNVGYNDWGNIALRTNDGGFIGAGDFNVLPPDALVFLVKTDSLGNIQWQKEYGDTILGWRLKNLNKTYDEGYLLSGDGRNLSNGDYFIHLIKTDSLGNQQWRKVYGSNKDEAQGHGIATRDGGYIIAGYRDSTSSYYVGYIVKTNAAGNVQWEKLYGDYPSTRIFVHITQLQDGNYLVTGTKRIAAQSAYRPKTYLAKLDPQGNIIWDRVYDYAGGISQQYPNDLKITSRGDFIMTGFIIYTGTSVTNDMFILKTDSCGYTVGDTTTAEFIISDSSNSTITFINQSQTFCSTSWLFGDGESSWLQNPTHTYQDTGTFTITLITRAGNTADTFQQSVTITSFVGMEEIGQELPTVSIYPNPVGEILNVELRILNLEIEHVHIYDINGSRKLTAKSQFRNSATKISIKELSPGIYFYQVQMNNGTTIRGKFVKQ